MRTDILKLLEGLAYDGRVGVGEQEKHVAEHRGPAAENRHATEAALLEQLILGAALSSLHNLS